MEPVRINFVCLGNICRSPVADAVLRHQAEQQGVSGRVVVESRGVGRWHLGERADPRMRSTASSHGVDIDGVSEVFVRSDYDDFDLILTMDSERQADLVRRAPPELVHKVVPFRTFDPLGGSDEDVPDPYYGGQDGFEEVFTMVGRTCQALLDRVLDGTWRDAL
jgi:protein-tyrosine phosphatase